MHSVSSPARSSYDVVIVGAGHNGLVAAAYLARAGRSVLVLERQDHAGGAAVSAQAFNGVDARLSRYSYLVSLLPQKIVQDLGLKFRTRQRRISSYTPTVVGGRPSGLLVEEDAARTRESFRQLTGSDHDFESWQQFYGMTQQVARKVFPTLTGPLPDRAELERIVDDKEAWEALFERPLGEAVEARFSHDLVRGVVLTDALIGTFTHAHDESLLQNRCFLYHVIGNGTGDWNVPVGGMGALTGALADAARAAGAEILLDQEVVGIDTDGAEAEVRFRPVEGERHDGRETKAAAGTVLANVAPATLSRLLGDDHDPAQPAPEGAQLKVNMLLRRLPKLRDRSVDPRDAFAGTFHIAESYSQLETAYREAAAGRIPGTPPSEIYCHSLTDPSILGPELAASGHHTLTLFGLHMPARLFAGDADAARAEALRATVAALDACLDEPIADCLAVDADGRPCIEAKTPQDLEAALGLPSGHIFHRDLSFPYGEEGSGRWGVETGHRNVLLCGAGAIRGGGVSGIPGHNAAMALLER
ncbi:phytoene desaturase family protein [Streptomyces cavernicola]|uniref:Pyridine nucleotide-disulfide oxidoreductase domain-containing protein 2 n=1 Tax=Streptomyces cavernicola TaxID=3043613 RepID=A0ABT6S955_9ACTN|nr:NAD(P)/FAD-dependent oxidoreductase [Streptomyces sp. B-S-A6]MDI3403958.1 NAD(P)/FAD-dependent oxidoreductase [Streptomyces sp. B-S-A6]